MFNCVTVSGKVRFIAIDLGTPNSSKAKLGSGETTVLAEKSTRFPIRFFLNLPSLPLRRSLIDLIGYPDLRVAFITPFISLFINVEMKYYNCSN